MGKISYYEKEADIKNYTRFMFECNKALSGRQSYGHFHTSVELVYVLEGRHVGYVNGRAVELTRDKIFFFNPYDIHYYNYRYDNRLYVVLLGQEYLADYRAAFGNKAFPNRMEREAENLRVRRILEEWHSRYEYENYLRNAGYADLLLAELADIYPPVPAKKMAGRDRAYRMLEFLNENYVKNITLGDLADHMGYNRAYCSQLFGKVMGTDFRSYLNDLRAAAAWKQMAEPDCEKTVLQVAMDCGFDSMNTFYRAFRRRYGKSPREMLSARGIE